MEKVELEEGKYTVLHDGQHGGLTVLRYDEVWRNETGDKLILAMFHEIQRLKAINEYDNYMNKEEIQWGHDMYRLLKESFSYVPKNTELSDKINDVIKAMNV